MSALARILVLSEGAKRTATAQVLAKAVDRWQGRNPTEQELAAWARKVPGES